MEGCREKCFVCFLGFIEIHGIENIYNQIVIALLQAQCSGDDVPWLVDDQVRLLQTR